MKLAGVETQVVKTFVILRSLALVRDKEALTGF